jgi:probable rRNA maturation factor
MNSFVIVSGRASKEFKDYAEKVALETLKYMKQPDGLEVSIKFVSENEIRELNNNMRNIDRVTDVLSFPATNLKAGEILDLNSSEYLFFEIDDEAFHFGDMAICTKQLRRQAKTFNNSDMAELKKLVIHSMLHLMGYDHIKDDDYVVMNKKEVELDSMIN